MSKIFKNICIISVLFLLLMGIITDVSAENNVTDENPSPPITSVEVYITSHNSSYVGDGKFVIEPRFGVQLIDAMGYSHYYNDVDINYGSATIKMALSRTCVFLIFGACTNQKI